MPTYVVRISKADPAGGAERDRVIAVKADDHDQAMIKAGRALRPKRVKQQATSMSAPIFLGERDYRIAIRRIADRRQGELLTS